MNTCANGSATTAKPKKQKSVFLRLLVVAFGVYLLFSVGSLITELSASKAELAGIENEKTETQKNIDEKKHKLENSTEEELMEEAAREHGYVYSNEIVLWDVSGN